MDVNSWVWLWKIGLNGLEQQTEDEREDGEDWNKLILTWANLKANKKSIWNGIKQSV